MTAHRRGLGVVEAVVALALGGLLLGTLGVLSGGSRRSERTGHLASAVAACVTLRDLLRADVLQADRALGAAAVTLQDDGLDVAVVVPGPGGREFERREVSWRVADAGRSVRRVTRDGRFLKGVAVASFGAATVTTGGATWLVVSASFCDPGGPDPARGPVSPFAATLACPLSGDVAVPASQAWFDYSASPPL